MLACIPAGVGRCQGESSTDLSRQGVHPDSQGRKREEVLRSAANHISRLSGYCLGGLLVRDAGHPPRVWHRKSNAGRFSQLLAVRANEKNKAAPVRHARHDADLVHRALACVYAGRRRPKPVIMAQVAGAFLRQWQCPAQGRSEFGRRMLDPSRLRQSLRVRMQRNEVLDYA